MNILTWLRPLFITFLVFLSAGPGQAVVQPGDTITKDNLAQAEGLLTPATHWMEAQE